MEADAAAITEKAMSADTEIVKKFVTVQKVTVPRGVALQMQGNPETYERRTA